jgi:hypothetical protein
MLGILAVPPVGRAQATAATNGDAVVASVTLEDLAPGSGGVSLSADWVRPLPRGVITAGLASVAVSGVRWSVGRLGGAWRMHPRVSGDAILTLGPGSAAGQQFFYRQARAAVSYAVVPNLLMLEAEGQVYDIAKLHGELVGSGLTIHPVRGIGTRVSYGRSVGGNYDADYLLLRTDIQAGSVGGLGGISVGKSAPRVEDLGVTRPADGSRLEIFGGATVPLYGVAWTVVLSHSWGDEWRRQAIVLTSRVPLR